MREVRIWRPFRAGEMSQIAAVNALSDAYVTYDDYKRLAGDLDDARRGIAWLKREIAEDAKATAESQEITGKYMADAERAEALIRQMGELAEKSLSEEKNVTAEDKQEVAHKIQDAIEAFRSSRRANDVKDVQ